MTESEVSAISLAAAPRGRVWRVGQRLADMTAAPGDGPEQLFLKRLQAGMALASLPAIGGWGLSYLLIGRSDAAWIPFGYCLATVALLALLAVTKRNDAFGWSHIALVFIAPGALHLYLGGFAASGGVALWCLLSPVAALMFLGGRGAALHVGLLFLLVGLGLAQEILLPSPRALTPAQASVYFAFNVVGAVLFLVLSTRYFLSRIQRERERADRLLLNILPAPIAARLKRAPRTIAERFESVTVVFSDIVGFTRLSERLPAVELVELLDEIFSQFDRLADELGLEKIKTIGDAYMVVAGLPEPCPDHAQRGAKMALAMRDALARFSAEHGLDVQMRIGIHTGEVVAGVIGRRKFSYDLWGDTVNTASRMESHGLPGRVQVTEATRAALGESFLLSDRGVVAVKGKGPMRTFWLDGLASASPDGAEANAC